MKRVGLTLPAFHPPLASIDQVLEGDYPVSGTTGAIIRLADALHHSGYEVTLSGATPISSSTFNCVTHDTFASTSFDVVILHSTLVDRLASSTSHGIKHLWLHNRLSWKEINTYFTQQNGMVITPSRYLAEVYRALPGWSERLVMIPHFFDRHFMPVHVPGSKRLLFVGAITPHSGFREVMAIARELADRNMGLPIALAGSIALHHEGPVGTLGVSDPDFEQKEIVPWLNSFPNGKQPVFLGALSPSRLRDEMAASWAVLVNPSWSCQETFCLTAVEAQACRKVVFSVAAGALPETVCRRPFDPLAHSKGARAVVDRIEKALKMPGVFQSQEEESARYVRMLFLRDRVVPMWKNLLEGKVSSLSHNWPPDHLRAWLYECLRGAHAGLPIHDLLRRS